MSYLNSKPYLYGLGRFSDPELFEISTDIPAMCAEKLIGGQAEVGLIPVAMWPSLPGARPVSGYGIAADGQVDSVLLCSQVPLEKIRRIVLDLESRTSANLARILAQEHWHIAPEWVQEDPQHRIGPNYLPESAVLIGDRALQFKGSYSYQYDLAAAWKTHTGLPFVFALWISNGVLPDGHEEALQKAFRKGLDAMEEVIRLHAAEYPYADLPQYLKERIKYRIGEQELNAVALYLQKLSGMGLPASGTVIAGEVM